jgi:hypothetical protein
MPPRRPNDVDGARVIAVVCQANFLLFDSRTGVVGLFLLFAWQNTNASQSSRRRLDVVDRSRQRSDADGTATMTEMLDSTRVCSIEFVIADRRLGRCREVHEYAATINIAIAVLLVVCLLRTRYIIANDTNRRRPGRRAIGRTSSASASARRLPAPKLHRARVASGSCVRVLSVFYVCVCVCVA